VGVAVVDPSLPDKVVRLFFRRRQEDFGLGREPSLADGCRFLSLFALSSDTSGGREDARLDALAAREKTTIVMNRMREEERIQTNLLYFVSPPLFAPVTCWKVT
jgi:hypothetical protein